MKMTDNKKTVTFEFTYKEAEMFLVFLTDVGAYDIKFINFMDKFYNKLDEYLNS